MLGREVTVPAHVDRVIGIGPGALRLLVYLEAEDRVVGVEELERRTGRPYIFACPELQDKPTIGPPFTGDAELIVARKPDVIFKTYTTKGEAEELEKKTGIPVVGLRYVNEGPSWRVLDSALSLMGRILDRSDRAKALTRYYQRLIDTLALRTRAIPQSEKPRVYLGGLSHRGTHGINSTSPWYESFVFVNARNVAAPLKKNYQNNEGVLLDIEQLMQWNPQVIFIDRAGRELVKKDFREHRAFFSHIRAFQKGQIYGVHPYNWYSTNYATVLANAWYVAKVLYPSHFRGTNPAQKADQIYQTFLGQGVYRQMEKQYGGYGPFRYDSTLKSE